MSPGARAFILLQHLLPQHLVTAAVYWLARRRERRLKNALIRGFCRLYPINLAEAEIGTADGYADFNAFFTRALKDGSRPLPGDPGALVSPCDGTVSERGTIDGSQVLQARLAAKSHSYSLEALVGDPSRAAAFVGGEFATIYLAPYNYHRVHAPLAGRLESIHYVPGALYSVNATTAAAVPGLFARNERVICHFATAVGPVAVIFVGALNVGSVSLVGVGEVTPRRPRTPAAIDLPAAREFARGAGLGHFNMGSTVILLLPRGSVSWHDSFVPRASVRMGEAIGRLAGKPPA
jgi:phosphatidylserine decarboxylase